MNLSRRIEEALAIHARRSGSRRGRLLGRVGCFVGCVTWPRICFSDRNLAQGKAKVAMNCWKVCVGASPASGAEGAKFTLWKLRQLKRRLEELEVNDGDAIPGPGWLFYSVAAGLGTQR